VFLAFVVGLVLNSPSQQSTALDEVAYPLFTVGIFFVYLCLLVFKNSTNAVILGVVSLSGLFLLSKLVYILFVASASINIVAEMTESFFWIPAMCLLGSFAKVNPRARILPTLFLTAMLLISLVFIVQSLRGPTPNYSAIYALIELSLANLTLLTLSQMLFAFKDDFVRAETHAETMQRLAHTDQLTNLAFKTASRKPSTASAFRPIRPIKPSV
jgi:diguanylate cyclase